LHTRQQLQLGDTGDSLRPSEADSQIAAVPRVPRPDLVPYPQIMQVTSTGIHIASTKLLSFIWPLMIASRIGDHVFRRLPCSVTKAWMGVATPLAGSKACGGGVGPRHRLKLPRRRLTKKAVSHPLEQARMKE
jgi:hypothetical protein